MMNKKRKFNSQVVRIVPKLGLYPEGSRGTKNRRGKPGSGSYLISNSFIFVERNFSPLTRDFPLNHLIVISEKNFREKGGLHASQKRCVKASL